MNTLKKYKKEVRKMFFISVKTDIERWSIEMYGYSSPIYKNSVLVIRTDYNELRLLEQNTYSYDVISKYKWWIIPTDFKVFWYISKLKRYVKKLDEDKKLEKEIAFYKDGLSNIRENFVKEVRKEKLEQIEKK